METESFLSQFDVDIFVGERAEKHHTIMTIAKHANDHAKDCLTFSPQLSLTCQNHFRPNQIRVESFGGLLGCYTKLRLKTSEHPSGLEVAVFFNPFLSELVKLSLQAIGVAVDESLDKEDKVNDDQSLFALVPEKQVLEVFVDDEEELNNLDSMQSQASDVSQERHQSNKLILVDREGVIPPVKGHATDAGIDIFIQEDYLLQPGQTMYMPAGCKFDLHPDYHVEVVTRSSTSDRYPGLVVTPTIVDCEYAGEISTIATNTNSDRAIKIEKGSRIAQLLLKRHYYFDDADITILDQNSRGEGRFGSTGSN